jgi:hypothetical protein
MTGPEHYLEAEAMLKLAESLHADSDYCNAQAQVHATLALVAATVNAAELVDQPAEFDRRHPNGGNLTWWRAIR